LPIFATILLPLHKPICMPSHKASWAIFLCGLSPFMVLYCFQPILPVMAKSFALSPAQSSLLLSVTAVSIAMGMLFSAIISDKIGRTKLMFWGMALSALLSFGIPLVQNFAQILVIRFLIGLALSGISAIIMTYISEEYQGPARLKKMGIYVSGTSIGGMLGRLITGFITDHWGWPAAIYSIGALSVVLGVLFMILLPPSQHFTPQKSTLKSSFAWYGHHLKNKALLVLVTTGFLFMGCFVAMYNFIGFLLSEAPFRMNSSFISSISVFYVFGAYSSIKINSWLKFAHKRRMNKILIGLMICSCLLTNLPYLSCIFIGLAGFTIAFFSLHTLASGSVSSLVASHASQASTLYLCFYYIGSAIIGTYGGRFYHHYGWVGNSAMIIGFLLIAFVLNAWRLKPKNN
jgi:MFS transporter, YNFM family, putative membrane transport protein